MKKIITFLSAASATLILTTPLSAVTEKLPFNDVKNTWYFPYVESVYEKGYMLGVSETEFEPESELTRAMYVTILGRMHDKDDKFLSCSFSDVSEDAWYRNYVEWAEEAKIVLGYSDGTFRGDDPISRQELAAMTSRYLEYIELTPAISDGATLSFNDADAIDEYTKAHVEKLRASAILLGDENKNFNPENTASRAEAAAIAVRVNAVIENRNSSAKAPSISGNPLEEYSLYSSELSSDELSTMAEIIKSKTGINLPTSEELTEKSIIFTVDDSLKMLEYSVTENGGKLTISVSTKYAIPYFNKILSEFVSVSEQLVIPENYTYKGSYVIDKATDCDGSFSIVCETNKNPLAYSVEDDITFRISMVCDERLVSVPKFIWSYQNEKASAVVSGEAEGYPGQAIFTVKGASAPGGGKLDLIAANENGKKITKLGERSSMTAGVMFNFADISPSHERPSDFDEFWDAQVNSLMAVEPKAIKFERCDVYSNEKYDVYDVWIDSIGDMSVAHVSVPKNAEPHSLKILADYLGYGDAGGFKPNSASDIISIAVNSHSVDNHGTLEYYREYDKKIEGWGFNNESRESSYFLDMIMRDIQAIRFVEVQFADLWNGNDIITRGGSMGGFQAVAVAALYDKVTRCEPSITWMSDIGGNKEGDRFNGWRPEYNDASKYYDTCYFAPRIKGYVKMSGGLGDNTCPPSGLISLYNSFTGAERISLSMTQCYGHGGSGGRYNQTFKVSTSEPVPDPMEITIKDNGCALDPPGDEPERELNPSEQAMKASAVAMKDASYNLFVWDKLVTFTFGTKGTIIKTEVEQAVYDKLIEFFGLSPSCKVTIDNVTFEALRDEHTKYTDGDEYEFELDYTITDNEGGYYDAQVTIYVSKIIE